MLRPVVAGLLCAAAVRLYFFYVVAFNHHLAELDGGGEETVVWARDASSPTIQ